MRHLALAALGLGLAAISSVQAAGPRPDFQLSGPCGTEWHASTYETHAPDPDSLDITVRDEDLNNLGKGWPVLAQAAGEITKADLFETPEKGDMYRINIDHGDGWKTIYLHSGIDDFDLLEVGRKVAQGEMIAWTSNSGATAIHQHITQTRDGDAVRSVFDGKSVETREADQSSWGHWGTNQAERILSKNCAGVSFMRWREGGRTYAATYRPTDGRIIMLRLRDDGSSSQTWTGNWGTGWTHLEPFQLNDQPHAILYQAATGTVRFIRIKSGGEGATVRKEGKWFAGWTHIEPFRRGDNTYLLVYSSLHGFANLERVSSDGKGSTNLFRTNWEKGRTALVSYTSGSRNYLFSYKGGSGRMRIQKITGSGNSVSFEQVWTRQRNPGWSTLKVVAHKGRRILLGCDAVEGKGKIWELDDHGQGLSETGELAMLKDWTAITTWPTDAGGQFLLYNLSNGEVKARRLNGAATTHNQIWEGTWTKGWR